MFSVTKKVTLESFTIYGIFLKYFHKYFFSYTDPFLVKVSTKNPPYFIFNLKITTALNRNLSGYFVYGTHKDC